MSLIPKETTDALMDRLQKHKGWAKRLAKQLAVGRRSPELTADEVQMLATHLRIRLQKRKKR